MTTKQRAAAKGFTLTELVVLMGVGSVLAGLLVADLSQTKTKFFQQACAGNLKHWGMAFNLYAQDYNGTLYYDVMGHHFDDTPSASWATPYLRYLGGGDPVATIRNMKICPARMGKTDYLTHSYNMPVGTCKYQYGHGYIPANVSGSPFFDNATSSYFPGLRFLPHPSSFLLLIECNGNTLICGQLVKATTTLHVGTGGDSLPAIAWHGGGVNCLFGDFHVEFVSSQVITNQDAISCPAGNPWFMLN